MSHGEECVLAPLSVRRSGRRFPFRAFASIYAFNGLRTIEDHQALLETAATETLALENSIARNRTIATIVGAGAKLLETGELADRLAALEAVLERTTSVADGLPGDDGL